MSKKKLLPKDAYLIAFSKIDVVKCYQLNQQLRLHNKAVLAENNVEQNPTDNFLTIQLF